MYKWLKPQQLYTSQYTLTEQGNKGGSDEFFRGRLEPPGQLPCDKGPGAEGEGLYHTATILQGFKRP